MKEWRPDVLGEGFEQLTLPLSPDDEGEVVATLVRRLPSWRLIDRRSLGDADVLYVHGWSDYFFNRRFGSFWAGRGARFYALDLRKYGRSLREGQTPGYITNLADYDEDLSAAFVAMGRNPDGTGARRLILVGHSTGGLVLSLWAARHHNAASALILNSPWLEFQLSATARTALSPVLDLHARMRPLDAWPQVDLGFYSRAQAEVFDPSDPYEVNAQWRPDHTMAVRIGWMRAIIAGHATVATGLDIDAPICVLLSARTAVPTHWSSELTSADTVLVVDDIARKSLKLGSSVTIERVDGALHDVFLSRHEAREDAYQRLDAWVTGMLARR